MEAAGSTDVVRVDRWLWAVRVYKTRAAATEACRAGHVRVNGSPAKAATAVRVGDRVVARRRTQPRELEVVRLLDRRVGAQIAATCYRDHSPAWSARAQEPPAPVRDAGTGRPTKRDRRQLDRFRRR